MKSASYFLIMIMLIAVGSLFVIKRPDGKPWLNGEAVVQTIEAKIDSAKVEGQQFINSTTSAISSLGDSKPSEPTTIYKWQDEQGVWHYSDKPNAFGDSQMVELDPNKITVMAAEDTSILNNLNTKPKNEPMNPAIGLTTIKPGEVKQLVEDAKNIQQLMDNRQKQLEEQID
jgi:hypothetical protein